MGCGVAGAGRFPRGCEMTQLAKSSLYNVKVWSLYPQLYIQRWAWWLVPMIIVLGGRGGRILGAPWPASLA